MNGDRDILSIPDSPAWRLGVLHERERVIRLLQQRREDLCVMEGVSAVVWAHHMQMRATLADAITAIREAG